MRRTAIVSLLFLGLGLGASGCSENAPTGARDQVLLPGTGVPGPAVGRLDPFAVLGRMGRTHTRGLASKAVAAGDYAGPLFGLGTAPNGDILVADAGAGITAATGRARVPGVFLPGVTDVGVIGRGAMWATTGAGEDPGSDTGQALYLVTPGRTRMIANLFAFEAASDPDQGEAPDSNPFDVAALGDSAALVVDAGGNSLLRVDREGNVEVLAVFPSELVSTENLANLIGCPDPFDPELAFLCETPMMPAEAVPTCVEVGPDGYYYVGELKGFPAPAGASNIWKVSPHASWAPCPGPDCEKVFDGGFTSIIDLAFDANGTLYVAELDELSWAAVEFLGGGVGGTITACDPAGTVKEVVATGIPILTAITVGKDGSLWSTVNALIPGLADVVEVP